MLTNHGGLIFYCERRDIPGAWQMPQGGIDPGENPKDGALRELLEETGIQDVNIKNQYPNWLVYDFPKGAPQRDGKIGQAQKWFLLEFTGDISTIDLNNAQDQEFSNYMWATPEHILETVADFRKPLYEECFRHLKLI